ncbi:FAD-dependent oxidoreductase [Paenibacillus sp. IHBB 10380]|uniref:FAD-dependent oxidoreductase n=1 Tax=Paenibacillus sp. IHBB 10380 TaxID=1566358 RepID=UPI0005CFC7E3|nr:FAD-dependent monooxygenase [Paenibacillus sp. IHBB 10380]
MKDDLKVVIIGGGLGGAATATALHKRGIQAHIYEQAPELTEVGAGIVMHPPTQHLLYKWGLGELCEEKGKTVEKLDMLTAKGELIADGPKSGLDLLTLDSLEGYKPRVIHRAHLLNTLLTPLSSEYIHLDHKCESMIEHEDHVEIRFTNGKVVQADVVIAADGIHSNTRKIFSNDEPIFCGAHSIRTIFSYEETKHLVEEKRVVMYQEGDIIAFLIPVANGVALDMIYPTQDASWSKSVDKELILSHVGHFEEGFVRLFDSLEYPVMSRALYFRQPLEKWSTSRITLLGDSAHAMLPTLGQGANSAIQDAEAIADALASCETITEAFEQYEQERRPVTTAIQTQSQNPELLKA